MIKFYPLFDTQAVCILDYQQVCFYKLESVSRMKYFRISYKKSV